MKNYFARRFGEMIARLESVNRSGEDLSKILNDCIEIMIEVLQYLPEEHSRSAKLARLIKLAEFADNEAAIQDVIILGLKAGRLRSLSRSEAQEARNNERKNLLIFLKQEVYGPADWENKGDQALVISVRQALGRIKRNG
jgi:hypothetical protein